MSDSEGPGFLDRAVDWLARTMDAVGLNGTRLRWRWNKRRRDIGEAGLRAQMFVRSARAPVKMCPQCRELVPRSAWTCPACGAGLSRVRAPGLTRLVSNLIPGATAATAMILLVNMVMFVVMLVAPPVVPDIEPATGLSRLLSFDWRTLLRYGSGVSELTFNYGEWWRLITPLFLHGGLLHIAMNSWALISLGPLAEEEYGTERFTVIYVLSGVCGSILSQYVGGRNSVGASGAICGLLGLLLVHGWRRGGAYGMSLRNAMLQNTFLMLVMSFAWANVIDWRGHVGGLLGGAVCGLIFSSGSMRSRSAAFAWSAAAFATVAITLVAFYMMATHGAETLRLVIQSMEQ